MKELSIIEMVDEALLNGTIEAECKQCGMPIQCETDSKTAWCEICEKVVKVKNPLIELGLR
jgi:hypothetical protein